MMEPLNAFRALGATEDELAWLTRLLNDAVTRPLEQLSGDPLNNRTDGLSPTELVNEALTAGRLGVMLAGTDPDTLPDGPLDPRTGNPIGA